MNPTRKLVYLDHAATTSLDPRVLEAMMPYLREHYGNPSSVHQLGRKARYAVEQARERAAACLGAEPSEIIFTSGATESNNLALKGILAHFPGKGLVTSSVEHKAVLQPAKTLSGQGYPVTYLRPDRYGRISPEQVAESITEETALVSIMMVHNELGTRYDVERIAAICRERGVLFHCDAVQGVGYYPIRLDEWPVDALSLSAHKFYGPKGVGVLFVRGGTPLRPLIEGGAQERNRRGGTEHVAGIVGLAHALELAVIEREERVKHVRALRDRLATVLQAELGDYLVINTPLQEEEAAPHILHVVFPPQDELPVDGEMLLLNLDMEGICVSSGSACTSGAVEPSHVLQAIGIAPDTAKAAVRFSLGWKNTVEEIDYTVEKVEQILRRIKLLSSR